MRIRKRATTIIVAWMLGEALPLFRMKEYLSRPDPWN
jgi:hypothetical protein